MKRHMRLHVVRRDVLLHALGGFAELGPMAARLCTSQEDEYLRQTYAFVCGCELWGRLPRRTLGAIRKRACNLGLTRTKRRAAMGTDPQLMLRDVLRLTALGGTAPQPSSNPALHANFASLRVQENAVLQLEIMSSLTKSARNPSFGGRLVW